MKKSNFALLFLVLTPLIFAQEKYEITEIDIFNLSKSLISSQLSVYGISIGDSMETALTKFKKSNKDVNFSGEVYSLDIGKDDFRIISKDNKVINAIVLFPNFRYKLKGKTAGYFDIPSKDRLISYVTGSFGEPDYIDERDTVSIYSLFYLRGFSFKRIITENLISLETKEFVLVDVKRWGAKKPIELNEDLKKPEYVSSTGFRKTLWGMSKGQVKKTEENEFIKEEKGGGDAAGLDFLSYKADVGGTNSVIVYYFAKDSLTRARYIVLASHSDYNLYIDDYIKIKNNLTEKYGAPARDQEIWSNNLYKDDASKSGMAVAAGHLAYVAEWYPIETAIQLLLRGDNFKLSLTVEYSSDKLRDFEEKVRKKAKKDIW
jgi:hypothetical protein